ncbi:DUF5708 family protein [Yinghuangia sp. YIM S09857]|uniref:DUF5708 family protein n=1 Tax=Yinghuangia sp. YIM S09857 TaxID=3436929 RepID=UPI003F539125
MRDVVIGIFGIAVGTALMLYAGDVDIPAIELGKLGLVLIVIGALDLLYGVFRVVTRRSRRTTA